MGPRLIRLAVYHEAWFSGEKGGLIHPCTKLKPCERAWCAIVVHQSGAVVPAICLIN